MELAKTIFANIFLVALCAAIVFVVVFVVVDTKHSIHAVNACTRACFPAESEMITTGDGAGCYCYESATSLYRIGTEYNPLPEETK